MERKTILSFSHEEGQNIIVAGTLLSASNTPEDNGDLTSTFMELKKLLQKDVKLELNAITLSDYWRHGLIPRGLRIRKFPAYSMDNKEFTEKWEAILNKCSLDLMLLLIEESKKDRLKVQQEITEVRNQLESNAATEEKENLEVQLQEELLKFTDNVKKQKVDKFKRDEKDYKDGRVYTWKRPTRNKQRGFSSKRTQHNERSVSFNLTSSDDDYLSDSRADSSSFLQSQPKPIMNHSKAREKRGEGERGRANNQHRPSTRSLTKRTL